MLKLIDVCALVVICSVSLNSAKECRNHFDCTLKNQFCGAGNYCRTKGCPQFCDMMYRPVCGTDGKTYTSSCRLNSTACNTQNADLAVASQGECAVKTTSPPELTPLDLSDQPTGHPTNQPTGPPAASTEEREPAPLELEETDSSENDTCTDVPNYKDKYGTTCKKMKEFGNCKDGKPGKISEQQLRVEANSDGVSPLDACCVCGGGQENETCTDVPNYKDKYGTTCKTMKEVGNCKDGKPGKISEQQLREEANSDGVSPLDACCVCGGGQASLP